MAFNSASMPVASSPSSVAEEEDAVPFKLFKGVRGCCIDGLTAGGEDEAALSIMLGARRPNSNLLPPTVARSPKTSKLELCLLKRECCKGGKGWDIESATAITTNAIVGNNALFIDIRIENVACA